MAKDTETDRLDKHAYRQTDRLAKHTPRDRQIDWLNIHPETRQIDWLNIHPETGR